VPFWFSAMILRSAANVGWMRAITSRS
jgi:hypothetical protein